MNPDINAQNRYFNANCICRLSSHVEVIDDLRASDTAIFGATPAIRIDASALAPGTHNGSIRLIPVGGSPSTLEITLAVLTPAPVLLSVAPARVPIGSDETVISVTGSGLSPSTKVFVNSLIWNFSSVTVVDATTLRLTLPKGHFAEEFTHSITVQNPKSDVSNALPLAVGDPVPEVARNGVVSAASYASGAVSSGEIVTIFGSNFGENTKVFFDGIPATLIYALPNQLSATVPYEIGHAVSTSLIVETDGRRSAPTVLAVTPSRPGLFAADASGKGQGAILNQDTSINSASNPAERGSIIVLYGTGEGPLTNDELPRLALPVKVFIDGIDSEVLYAGIAPGLVTGAIQINVRVPESATAGEIVLKVADVASNSVTVALR